MIMTNFHIENPTAQFSNLKQNPKPNANNGNL